MFKRLFTRVFGKKKQQKPLMPEILFNDFIKEISPNDLIYQSDNLYYFYWGKWALDCVERTLKKVGKQEIKSILDLPCGHGRALRFFKVAFPKATLTACEIDRDGVDFCVRTFGAKGVYSTKNPDEIQLDEKFDLIWVGSLLTHLDQDLWQGFLKFFSEHLKKDGILIFTTHGERIIKMLRTGKEHLGLDAVQINDILQAYDSAGFGYSDFRGKEDIGVSLSSPEWVLNLLKEFPNLLLIEHNPTGWGSEQYYQEQGIQTEAFAQDTFAYIQRI